MPILKGNPALEKKGSSKQTAQAAPTPDLFGKDVKYIPVEKRSVRITVLTTGTVKAELKSLADRRGKSVNDIINQALEKYLGID